MPGGQRAVVVGAQDPQPGGKHLPVLLLGLLILAPRGERPGDFVPDGQRVGVVGAQDPQPGGEQIPEFLLSLGVLAAKQVRGRNLEAQGQDRRVIGAQPGRILQRGHGELLSRKIGPRRQERLRRRCGDVRESGQVVVGEPAGHVAVDRIQMRSQLHPGGPVLRPVMIEPGRGRGKQGDRDASRLRRVLGV